VGEKTNKQGKEGETDWREVEAMGMHDLPTILLINSVLYTMFPHNKKRVL
jgi:hypothetical protein